MIKRLVTHAKDGYSDTPTYDYVVCTSCKTSIKVRKSLTVVLTPGGVGHVCDSTPSFIINDPKEGNGK